MAFTLPDSIQRIFYYIMKLRIVIIDHLYPVICVNQATLAETCQIQHGNIHSPCFSIQNNLRHQFTSNWSVHKTMPRKSSNEKITINGSLTKNRMSIWC